MKGTRREEAHLHSRVILLSPHTLLVFAEGLGGHFVGEPTSFASAALESKRFMRPRLT